LRGMIAGCSAGDHLLFHYSGHGTQIASADPSQPDGLDEALVPVNFDWNDPSTALTRSELQAILATVPDGVALTLLADACYSGGLAKAFPNKNDKARFLPPPVDVQMRLAGRTRVVQPRLLTRT